MAASNADATLNSNKLGETKDDSENLEQSNEEERKTDLESARISQPDLPPVEKSTLKSESEEHSKEMLEEDIVKEQEKLDKIVIHSLISLLMKVIGIFI